MTGLDLSLPSGADPSNLPPQQPLDLSFSPPSLDPLTEHPAYQAEMQRLKDTEQARTDTFLANYRVALKSNPTMVGEAQQIASKLGQPPDAVENNLDVAREVYRQRSLRDRELMRTHPILMQSLQNRHFLRLAHDDLDNLAATDTVFAMMGRKWESGQAMNERGYIGSRMAAGLGTQADKDRLAELNAITENASRDSGFVASTTEVLGQMAGTIPTALAVGGAAALPASLGGPLTAGTAFAWGFGATVFAQSAMIEGGNQYIDLIDMGVDPDKAAVMALGVGLINGALELVGTKVVAKPFQLAAKEITHRVIGGLSKETAGKAFGEFVKEYAKSVGGEVTTEVLQEITNVVTESIARPEGQPEPTWGEIRGRLGEIALKTAQGMSVLALPGPVLHYASQSQRAAEATQRAEAFQRQVELSAESKVRAANPQGHEDYVSKVAEATKNADLYVDAPAFAKAMQSAGVTRADLQQKEPELFRQLEKAEEHPDLQMDVVLKNAAFQSRLAKTPLGDALMEHVRHSQDGMSMAEAQQWISEQQKLAKEAGSLVQEKQATDKAFVDSAKRVEDAIYEQVKATGRIVDAKEARTAAQFYRDFVITQAARRGLTPEQFHAQYPLQVKREDGQTGARFHQFAGFRAKGAPKAALSKAIAMAEAGATDADVFNATGWSVGPTGDLRFEISDADASLRDGGGKTLGEVLDHPRLFKAYPKLAAIPVMEVGGDGKEAAAYTASAPTSIARRKYPGTITVRSGLSPEQHLSFLLHEVQHAIQDIEGVDILGYTGKPYRTSAVEVEARNTQSRQKMTAAERRAKPPATTEDVARSEQVRLEVPTDGQTGARFDQLRTDTPEFKAWFGDSKVVDAEGKPQVYYHATGAQFSEFRRARLRGASFFSATPESAFTGASASANEGMAPYPDRTIPVYLAVPNLYGRSYVLPKGVPDVRGVYPANAGQESVEAVHAAIADALFSTDPSVNRLAKEIAVEEWGRWHHTRRLASGEWELYRTDHPSEVAGDTVVAIPETRAAMWWQTFERGPGGRADAPGVGSKALEALGYDGALISDEGVSTVAVFDGRRIKSVNNRGTYDPNDPNILRAGEKASPRGGFIPDSLTILLHEKADSSTFFHEAAHAFLTIYADLAAKGDALATADMQTLLDWFGVKDMATWNEMSLEQQRKHHEKFAYSFEGYLFDGKAPSLEMQGLFDRFKVWLRRVYKTIRDSIGATYEKEFGEPLPILTGEVRSVMDRMLASEDAIAEAEAVRGMAAIYQTQEQSGMDDAAWAAYQDEARKAREAGVASLEKDSLRQMQWLDGARSKRLKAMQAEHKEIRDKVRREVVAEVAARPETRADRWLRTGRTINEDGTTAQGDKDTNHKLNRATVEAMGLGPAATARLEDYLRADGLSPDAVAEWFGYDSGEGMLRALAAMKPFGEAVDARTTERMLAEHSDLADPAEVEAAVERALHNEVRARFVAIELRHLAKSTQPVRLMLAAAKEAARTAIANLPFREASAKKFAQNEARAARQVVEALRKGDSALAAEWQQKRLLQHALATVAGEFQEQAAKDLRNLSRFQRPDAKLAKTRDTDLVNAARWILSRFNLGTPSQEATATRALTAIAKYDAAMSRQLAPLIQDADQNGRDYRDLTVEQFRDLMAKVDGLWNDSKRSQQIRIDGKLMERAVAREAIVAQLVKSGLHAAGKDQPIRRAVGSVAASLRHVESWALEMDGGQPGPVHKYLFQLLRDPVNDFLLERTQMRNELDVAIRKLPTLYGRKFEAKELIDQKTGKPHVFQNRHELVGFLLHAGNEDNLRIDAVGRGWVTLDADGNANLAPVWRFIERMVNEGHLTKADFDFAQGNVWDVFESRLKARAQEAHKDNYGYYFNEIEAKPITVRFPNGETATYRGGYMPAKADIDEDTRVGMVSVDGVTESGGEFMDRHPSAPKEFMINRTGINRPLSHDLRLASQAFSEELQFIHLQRPGRDLASILNDKEVSAAIQGVDQRALQDMFFPWLQDTMRNRLMAPGGNPMVNKALIALRRNVGLAYMFGNISNGIQQLTGFATSLTYVPLKHLRAGMKLAMRASEREQMLADSKFMLLRLDKRMGQITDDIDLILNPTWLGNVQKWTQRHGYFLQQWFQAPVDVVTWLGAKDHAIAQGKTNAEAIVWADAAVRRSQGSGTAADISRLERSSAVVRLLTQFGSFWLASLNTILQRHGPEQAKATATIIAFAGVTAGALSQALKGGWDDDDEDGALWDDIAGWAVGEAAKTGASLVPIVGSMAYSLVTGDRGGRLSPAATLGAAEQGSRGLRALAAIAAGKRDAKGQDIKDVSLFLSVILGAAPASLAARPISYQFDVSRGNVQPTGPVDYARGLATGTPAPGTKK